MPLKHATALFILKSGVSSTRRHCLPGTPAGAFFDGLSQADTVVYIRLPHWHCRCFQQIEQDEIFQYLPAFVKPSQGISLKFGPVYPILQ